ncbi:hypothetical protein CPCC7001_238 [Cyanobium sp. PCC 7001]|nr:hypothetical protein CPCC7001_238 [Cyanobium sp. PCC 7001]
MLAPVVQRLQEAFQDAAIPIQLLPDWDFGVATEAPLLVLYPPPDQALTPEWLQEAGGGLAGSYHRLLAQLEAVAAGGFGAEVRLVNLALSSAPRLIGWSVDRLQPLIQGEPVEGAAEQCPDLWFQPRPEPFDARLTLDLLEADPAILAAYLALEAHPLAASAEGRNPDRHYPERLRQAAGLERLLAQRHASARADADLRLLGGELGAARAELIDAAWIRQQLSDQLHQMQAALDDLELSQVEVKRLEQELAEAQLRHADLQANQQMIQSTLEQAVQHSRSQGAMQGAALGVISALLRQLSRTRGA